MLWIKGPAPYFPRLTTVVRCANQVAILNMSHSSLLTAIEVFRLAKQDLFLSNCDLAGYFEIKALIEAMARYVHFKALALLD